MSTFGIVCLWILGALFLGLIICAFIVSIAATKYTSSKWKYSTHKEMCEDFAKDKGLPCRWITKDDNGDIINNVYQSNLSY